MAVTSGEIKIVQDAANSDIQKIREAKAKLEDSKNSISRLKSAASSMQGQTGQAITDKAAELENKISNSQSGLIQQLDSTISAIKSAVQWYENQDTELAGNISGATGM